MRSLSVGAQSVGQTAIANHVSGVTDIDGLQQVCVEGGIEGVRRSGPVADGDALAIDVAAHWRCKYRLVAGTRRTLGQLPGRLSDLPPHACAGGQHFRQFEQRGFSRFVALVVLFDQ